MRVLHFIAGFFLFFELPVPLYWLILHPLTSFWRGRIRQAFWIAALTAWTAGGLLLWTFRLRLLSTDLPSLLSILVGVLLIGLELYLFWRVEHELGSRRLVGHAELTGRGDMFTGGLYARVRHPRYTGMFCAVLGATLLAGTRLLWIVVGLWCLFSLAVIRLEEHELLTRFGASYGEYRRRVPAFLPRLRRYSEKS